MNYIIGIGLIIFIIIGSYFIYKQRRDKGLSDMEKILRARKDRE